MNGPPTTADGALAGLPGSSTVLRRAPVQRRSSARVERILDVAGDLLQVETYESLSTVTIAEQAGVSVGALYQFFADKRAVVRALAERNLARFVALFGEDLRAQPAEDWRLGVARAFDTFIALARADPGFRAVQFGDTADIRLLDDDRVNDQVVGDQLVGTLAGTFGLVVDDDLRRGATRAVMSAGPLAYTALRADPREATPVLTDIKRILVEQLQPWVRVDPRPGVGWPVSDAAELAGVGTRRLTGWAHRGWLGEEVVGDAVPQGAWGIPVVLRSAALHHLARCGLRLGEHGPAVAALDLTTPATVVVAGNGVPARLVAASELTTVLARPSRWAVYDPVPLASRLGHRLTERGGEAPDDAGPDLADAPRK